MRFSDNARLLCCIAVVAMAATARAGTIDLKCCLIISEVVDGDRSGGNPKFVEITNTSPVDYTFTNGGIIVQSNADTDLNVEVDLTGVTIPGLDSYVIQSTGNDGVNQFETVYGFSADLYTPVFFSNGDDRYILVDDDGTAGAGGVATLADILDIHGQINVDGTGSGWEYLDSYAYRLPAYNKGNQGTFVIGEWFHGGNGALDAPDDPARDALLLANTTPGTHAFTPCVPEPSTAGLVLIAALGLVGLGRRSA